MILSLTQSDDHDNNSDNSSTQVLIETETEISPTKGYPDKLVFEATSALVAEAARTSIWFRVWDVEEIQHRYSRSA